MPSLWTLAIGRFPRRTLRRACWWAIATALLFGALLRPVVIQGRSMEPTLPDGGIRLATRWWTDAQRRPSRGDVVVIRRVGARAYYLKRVIALPNETIAFTGGALYINGREMPEPYLKDRGDWTMPELRLGPNEFFVAGDNRSMPIEEHALGRVERNRLAGRIWL
jgi:signal peptidase I, bacterial type